MKKLMFVAAAMLAGAAVADVTSANVVGYQEQASRAGFNYMTPTFVKVGGGLLTAQDLQMQEGLAAATAANIQIRDYRGVAPKAYSWYPRNYFEVSMAGKAFTDDTYTTAFVVPEGKNGVWAFETYNGGKGKNAKYWYEVLDKEFAPADAVQIYTKEANTKMTTSGEVPNENTFITSIAGFNYVGNPYPVAIQTKDIQMQDGLAAATAANIQIRDYRGVAPKAYSWYPRNYFEVSMAGKAFTDDTYTTAFVVPEGANGVWAFETYNGGKGKNAKYWYEVLDQELKPGEGIQVYTKDAGTEITVLCPYDL